MGEISYNSSETARALTSMKDSEESLAESSKEYINTLENEVYTNLLGSSANNFMNQTKEHCDNLAKICKNMNEISGELNNLNNRWSRVSEEISRGGAA